MAASGRTFPWLASMDALIGKPEPHGSHASAARGLLPGLQAAAAGWVRA